MVNLNFNQLNKKLAEYNQEQAMKILLKEGQRLEKIARKLWRKYLDSYKPKMYAVHMTGSMGKRTGNSERAIKLGGVKMLPDGMLGIELTWENDLVYHPSVFGGKYPKGHSVMLISDGWHSRKLEARIGRVERLTYFEGTGYLYQVYKEYMRTAPKGVWLDVQWSGKYTKK